jgi:hypothetical protein
MTPVRRDRLAGPRPTPHPGGLGAWWGLPLEQTLSETGVSLFFGGEGFGALFDAVEHLPFHHE